MKNKKQEKIRLNKYISNSGVCSRREADKLIANGMVKVDDKVIKEMGFKVDRRSKITVKGEEISGEKKVYLLLNKPKGFVTTTKDPHAKKDVMDIVGNACSERIYPVGRLDKQTTGLLLFTNDGELTKKLTHPKYEKKKIYHVFLNKDITKNHVQELIDGVELEDGFINADGLSFVDKDDKKQVGIEMHSGRKRIVRRMFKHLGYEVVKLDRVYFAGLTKKNLPRGKFRFLNKKEISILKSGRYD